MIRMHPEVGYNILTSIEFPYPVAQIVLSIMNGWTVPDTPQV